MTKTDYPWGDLPPLRIYNTLTRREAEFPTVDEHPEVTIYVCGPTTYQFVHVGNMRGPVFFDVVRRILRAHGYRVVFVTNFTDIDDKTIAEAKKAGEADPIQWSARFVHEYYTDLFGLGVAPADFYPKVSTHIPEIIDYVKAIEANGHSYIGRDGSVYFDVKSYSKYLELSKKRFDDLLDESRQDDTVKDKRDPRDFALWKAAKPGEPSWPSPWGDGRPGWHIECSLMSSLYLGKSFDIHGGGQELKFPHHENELAQAKCAYPNEDFARIWMHYEWVTLKGGDKMAKSGTSILVRDVLKKHDPEVIRLFILSAHYRKSVEFSFEKLDELAKAKARIVDAFNRLTEFLRWRAEEREENWLRIWRHMDERVDYDIPTFVKRMVEGTPTEDLEEMGVTAAERLVDAVRVALYRAHYHLADDFSTQGAVGELFQLVNRVNAYLPEMSSKVGDDFDAANVALGAIAYLSQMLGILGAQRDSLYLTEEAREEMEKGGGDAAKLAEVLLRIREIARAEKNFELSDRIRDQLAEIGAEVRDLKDGAKIVWK
jgi:cysteinyl-tRNA synthetase